MKGMCYIILIVAFLMFYQREPVFSIIILGMIVGLYLFFRSRRSTRRGKSKGILGSFLGGNQYQENQMDDLITLMMVQQLFQNSNKSANLDRQDKPSISEKENNIEKTKNEILDLFENKRKEL
jgi:hypothetical protein